MTKKHIDLKFTTTKSVGGLNKYIIDNIKDLKNLNKDEEYDLLRDYYENNNQKSLKRLIDHNSLLMIKLAQTFSSEQNTIDDLFQNAVIGFMVAIERFDMSRNFRLSTFAVHYCKKYICKFISKNNTVNLPSTKYYDKDYSNLSFVNFDTIFRENDEDYNDDFNDDNFCDNNNYTHNVDDCDFYISDKENDNNIDIFDLFDLLDADELYIVKNFYGIDNKKKSLRDLKKEYVNAYYLKQSALNKMRSHVSDIDLLMR